MNIYDHNEVNIGLPPTPPENNKKPLIIITAILSAVCFLLIGAVTVISIFMVRLYNSLPESGFSPTKSLSEKLMPHVVEVKSGVMANTALGSGIIVDINGGKYIITNHHVVKNSLKHSVRFNLKSEFTPAVLMGYDEYHDVALLKCDNYPEGLGAVIDDSGNVATGEYVLAIGNNLGDGISVFDGIISNKSRMISPAEGDKTVPVYQITSPINAGMSGGALFNASGALIGLNTYQSNFVTDSGVQRPVDGVCYSVPASIVKPIAHQIVYEYDGVTAKQITRISVQNFANNFTEIYFNDLNFRAKYTDAGLEVTYSTSSVEMSGGKIEEGDIVVKIGGINIDFSTGYPPLFAEVLKYVHNPSLNTKNLSVTLKRGDKTINISYDNKRLKDY